ncbi:MAG: amidohydrolase [Actinomycetota bacterium]|nr:amidohydrolase [Actinomycetota bacterium]
MTSISPNGSPVGSDDGADHSNSSAGVRAIVRDLTDSLVTVRRDFHAHPELAWQEHRTTAVLADLLSAAGVQVQTLPVTGLVAEVGRDAGLGESGTTTIALRADLDALPLDDRTPDPWKAKVDGLAHACGHDVHAACLLGAGLTLQRLHDTADLPGRVRLIFQPAEEVMPGGAFDLVDAGVLEGVSAIYALHCDPSREIGTVGLRDGAITSAADAITVRLTGRGGHTSRPHLTEDLTYALGKVITDVPAALSRRLDPRAGAALVWGYVRSGVAQNVIPSIGEVGGTVRVLDEKAWAQMRDIVTSLVHQVVAPYGVDAEVNYVRGVPPVVNEPAAAADLAAAATSYGGAGAVGSTEQSLGGEDFSWYLQTVPGAMARLGTRTPGGPVFDLHQGDLRVDDGCLPVGTALLAQTALSKLHDLAR